MTTTITILPSTKKPANAAVLGGNLQWVDNGDGLVGADGKVDPSLLDSMRGMGLKTLRYPGGTLADYFHWGVMTCSRDGVRPPEPVRYSPPDFDDTCDVVGSKQIWTGNLNDDLTWLPVNNPNALVELGNEPYLTTNNKWQFGTDANSNRAEYLHRAKATSDAMKSTSSAITVGIPLRVPTMNGTPVTPDPQWAQTMLAQTWADWYALHWYGPWCDPNTDLLTTYRSMFASAGYWKNEIAWWKQQRTGFRAWITEFAVIPYADGGYSRVASPAAHLAEINALLGMLTEPAILGVCRWSTLGNGCFGSIDTRGGKRTKRFAALAYEGIAPLLAGKSMAAVVGSAPYYHADATRYIPGATINAVGAWAFDLGTETAIVLINRQHDKAIDVTVKGIITPSTASVLRAGSFPACMDGDAPIVGWEPLATTWSVAAIEGYSDAGYVKKEPAKGSERLTLMLPAASLAVVRRGK